MNNNEFMLRQTQYFSERVIKEAGPEQTLQATHAFDLAIGRSPTEQELWCKLRFLELRAGITNSQNNNLSPRGGDTTSGSVMLCVRLAPTCQA